MSARRLGDIPAIPPEAIANWRAQAQQALSDPTARDSLKALAKRFLATHGDLNHAQKTNRSAA